MKRTNQEVTSLTPVLVSYYFFESISRMKIFYENFKFQYDEGHLFPNELVI
jgi:hypothetical protein